MSGACPPSSAESTSTENEQTDKEHEMSKVTTVNKDQFETEVLKSNLPVLIDFYATWCPPCRALAPVLDRMAEEFAGQVKIVKINSDEEPELAQSFNVTGLPTLVFIQNGEKLGQSAGLPREDDLRAELKRLADSHQAATD